MLDRTRHFHSFHAAVAILALAACARRDGEGADVDSALSRDLTLANAIAAPGPALRDTPDSAPVALSAPAARPVAPARATVRMRRSRVAPTPQTAQRAPAPPVEPPASEPAPAAVPAPEAGVGVIAAGTSGSLTLDDRACSDANRPGDKMVAHTSEALTGTNGVVLPAGSTVVIEVASTERSENPDSSTISFRVKSITANGVTYAAAGDVVPTGSLEKRRVASSSADAKKVVGGAILGAVIGRVVGGGTRGTVVGAAAGAAVGSAAASQSVRYETCVPAGATLRMTIGAPVDVGL